MDRKIEVTDFEYLRKLVKVDLKKSAFVGISLNMKRIIALKEPIN